MTLSVVPEKAGAVIAISWEARHQHALSGILSHLRSPIRETRTITPMGTLNYAGTSYSTPPERIGAAATLYVRQHRIDMVVGKTTWSHDRADHTGKIRRHDEHRRAVLAVIHGERKRRYFRRQCLLELGPPANDFLEQLVHRCPGGTWSPHVDVLYELLIDYGSEDLLTTWRSAGRSWASVGPSYR